MCTSDIFFLGGPSLYVANLQDSVEFYTKVFGMKHMTPIDSESATLGYDDPEVVDTSFTLKLLSNNGQVQVGEVTIFSFF